MKKIRVVLTLLILILPLASVTLSNLDTSTDMLFQPTNHLNTFVTSEGVSRSIRIAVYDEPNTTLPEYATGLGMAFSNDIDPLTTVLKTAGYTVDYLTVHDILNHQLLTVNYDVFIMVDNYPRENITNLVKEFWLGGGGVLGINAAFGYLCWDGIIIPEAVGDDAYGLLWDEFTYDSHFLTERHPITKNYPSSATLTEPISERELINGGYIKSLSSIGPYFHIIANATDYPLLTTVVALDNILQGGRSAGICTTVTQISTDLESLLIDTMDWLCPRPKGRILFDLTHSPRLGVDPWDELAMFGDNFVQFRNILVNRTYCFDKLYPSPSGNFTTERLAPYDMLIVVQPDSNFTEIEVAVVDSWVQSGGGLFVLGDRNFMPSEPAFNHTNFLMSPYDLSLYPGPPHDSDITADPLFHPTTEECSSLRFGWPKTYVNITETAEAIWFNDNNIWIASQEKGTGRIVLSGDINWPDDIEITNSDNMQFAINVANWLTGTEVLVYADSGNLDDPNDDIYRGPVADALNELGLVYMLTSEWDYFNLSLHRRNWELVVVDCNYHNPSPMHSEIKNYLEGGGKLVIRSWTEQYSGPYDLWPYLGIKPNGTVISSGPPTFYLWNLTHPVFSNPHAFSSPSISSSLNAFATDYVAVDLYPNATGIAGLDVTPPTHRNASAVILSVGGRAIVNTMVLSGYDEDSDDSTYADSVELWANEIAYLMRPSIDSPADDAIEAGTENTTFTWTPESDRSFSYTLTRNGSLVLDSGPWDGSPLAFEFSNLDPGVYFLELSVYDTAGQSASDTVILSVFDTVAPTISEPMDFEYIFGTTGNSITWNCSDLYPDYYVLLLGTAFYSSSTWIGNTISVDIDGLSVGTHVFTLTIYDSSGNSVSDVVEVTVIAETTSPTTTTDTTTTPTTTSSTTTTPDGNGTDYTIIIIIVIVGGLVIIVIVCMTRGRNE